MKKHLLGLALLSGGSLFAGCGCERTCPCDVKKSKTVEYEYENKQSTHAGDKKQYSYEAKEYTRTNAPEEIIVEEQLDMLPTSNNSYSEEVVIESAPYDSSMEPMNNQPYENVSYRKNGRVSSVAHSAASTAGSAVDTTLNAVDATVDTAADVVAAPVRILE